jgi:hypothetical protein
LNEIEQLDTKELSELAKLLTMKTTNINSIINILTYLDKLYNNDIIFDNVIFPKEVTQNILNNANYKTISSILSTSKNVSKLLSNYKDITKVESNSINERFIGDLSENKLFLGALLRELKHVNYRERTYYNLPLYDIRLGNRLFLKSENSGNSKGTYENYIVTSVDKNKATVQKVDVLGNIIDDKIINIEAKRERGIMVAHWIVKDSKNFYSHFVPGILLYDKGPVITDINSPYLKYKTIPWNINTDNPEVNMTVTVNIYVWIFNTYLYVIESLTSDSMILHYIDSKYNDSDIPLYLNVYKIDGDWIIPDEYKYESSIWKIGGFY